MNTLANAPTNVLMNVLTNVLTNILMNALTCIPSNPPTQPPTHASTNLPSLLDNYYKGSKSAKNTKSGKKMRKLVMVEEYQEIQGLNATGGQMKKEVQPTGWKRMTSESKRSVKCLLPGACSSAPSAHGGSAIALEGCCVLVVVSHRLVSRRVCCRCVCGCIVHVTSPLPGFRVWRTVKQSFVSEIFTAVPARLPYGCGETSVHCITTDIGLLIAEHTTLRINNCEIV
jgi:hypothetical protein